MMNALYMLIGAMGGMTAQMDQMKHTVVSNTTDHNSEGLLMHEIFQLKWGYNFQIN